MQSRSSEGRRVLYTRRCTSERLPPVFGRWLGLRPGLQEEQRVVRRRGGAGERSHLFVGERLGLRQRLSALGGYLYDERQAMTAIAGAALRPRPKAPHDGT
jgi:hypothetical protein